MGSAVGPLFSWGWADMIEIHGISIISLPQTEIILIPGSLGLAIAGAMGAGALQRDLQTFKFGWRQMVPVTAIVAITMTVLPFLSLTVSGIGECQTMN